jgi:two-component system LytT family response regulator
MRIDCVIVDDEPLAVGKIREFVQKVPHLNLLAAFHSGTEAFRFIKENKVDLIFLDIEMDELSGLELIESLSAVPFVIVTTAYERYAVKGYELNVADYLLKPIRFDRFLRAVEKVFNAYQKEDNAQREYSFIQSEYKNVKVSITDILYIEGLHDYRGIVTESSRILTLKTFQDLEAVLPGDKLVRVHKSFIVAINKIQFVERNRIRIKDKLIPLSETYKERFFSLTGLKDTRL